MASSLLKHSERHGQLVAECNILLARLPSNDYLLHDMGLRIIVRGHKSSKSNRLDDGQAFKIEGLSTGPIDFWDDHKLEKFYSKLSLILMSIYETESKR